MTQSITAYRAPIAHMTADPRSDLGADALETFDDGLLIVSDGYVAAIGPYDVLQSTLPADAPITVFDDAIIIPGLVDAHVHYPQIGMMGAYGAQLLDWLNDYAFPAERAFADAAHAAEVADAFVDLLLSHGTTTALVFGTVHAHSVDALFRSAHARNMRLIGGKVLMDRNAPEDLLDGEDLGRSATAQLIERWHGEGRLGYAITPRFAPTSTDAQLAMAGELLRSHPSVLLHTHLSENTAETKWVKKLFPHADSYLDAYRQYDLLTERSIFAHCIHLSDEDVAEINAAGAAIAHCPSSNMFLGSGLFDLDRAASSDIKLGIGTDVGAGTSLSVLSTIGDAYKVAQLRGGALSPALGFYLATLGGATALGVDDEIGNLTPGKEADFLVLDLKATPLLERRLTPRPPLSDTLFALGVLSDDRAIAHTYVAGTRRYSKSDRFSGV